MCAERLAKGKDSLDRARTGTPRDGQRLSLGAGLERNNSLDHDKVVLHNPVPDKAAQWSDACAE